MYRSFLFYIVLVSNIFYSADIAGQTTNNKTTAQAKTNNPTNPLWSALTLLDAPNEPNSEAKGLFERGSKLEEAGQFSQAAENFQRAIKLAPDYAQAYAALGRAYFKMRQWQNALVNFRRAAELKMQTKRLSEAAADDPQLKSHYDNTFAFRPEPAGIEFALSVAPPSIPAVVKSSSPIAPSGSSPEVSPTKVYRVGPRDVLDIQLNDSQSTQSTLFTVTPSGLLEHPMLPEPLVVTDLTPAEIAERIGSELSKRALVDNPKVQVGVSDYASHAILISGLVKYSGTKFLRREAIPLYVVVANAQPLPEATRVTVGRSELNEIYEIDLTQAPDMNLLVRPGDVITLLPNVVQFIYIGGEVNSPGEKTYRRDLSLMKAIESSGGATPRSTIAAISRDDGRGFLVTTQFNLKDIESGKVEDPLLRPGDRIMLLH